jgi:hypothetical protein
MKKSKTKREALRIRLDFKQTVLAALETKPEPRKKKASKNSEGRKE